MFKISKFPAGVFSRLLVLTGSLFLILILLEGYFRIFYPQLDDSFFCKNDRLGWQFIPNKTGRAVWPPRIVQKIRINPQGFRDDPFEWSGAQKKIMVLGDSFVSNMAVPHDKIFTEIMETRLRDVSVMNLGVNGYGQVQEFLLLEQFADVYKPRAVIVMIYTLNDFIDNSNQADWTGFRAPYARRESSRQGIEIILPKPPGAIKVSLFEKSHLAQFVIARRNLLQVKMARFFEKNDYFSPESIDTDLLEMLFFRKDLKPEIEESYRISEQLLSMISEECKKRNIPHLFVIAPSRGQVDPRIFEQYVSSNHKDRSRYDWLKPNKVLAEYAQKNNLPLLDLYPRLAAEHRQGKRLYDEDEEHWTAAGNQVVADEILKYIRTSRIEIR